MIINFYSFVCEYNFPEVNFELEMFIVLTFKQELDFCIRKVVLSIFSISVHVQL